MLKGKLVEEKALVLREQQQFGTYTDPVDGKEHEIQFHIWIGGGSMGQPIVEVAGRMVSWNWNDLVEDAVAILRAEKILPAEKPAKKAPPVKGSE